MKKVKMLALIALISITGMANAQDKTKAQKEQERTEREEKVDKLKIAYLTTELNLTTAEAEKFWPVYNEQETKLKELRKSGKDSHKNMKENFDSMSDSDAKKQMDLMWENHAKENAIRKEYSDKFIAILGAKRTLKLMHAEHEFRRELLERLKEQPGPGGPRGKGHKGDK